MIKKQQTSSRGHSEEEEASTPLGAQSSDSFAESFQRDFALLPIKQESKLKHYDQKATGNLTSKLSQQSRKILFILRNANTSINGSDLTHQIIREEQPYSGNYKANYPVDSTHFKNVQRRVYDVVNVLRALKIVRKSKHEISYIQNNPYEEKSSVLRSATNPLNDFKLLSQYMEKKKKFEAIAVKYEGLRRQLMLYQKEAQKEQMKGEVQVNVPFMVIGSSEPLPMMQSEDGSSIGLKLESGVDFQIMTDFEFLEEKEEVKEESVKFDKHEDLISRLERLDPH